MSSDCGLGVCGKLFAGLRSAAKTAQELARSRVDPYGDPVTGTESERDATKGSAVARKQSRDTGASDPVVFGHRLQRRALQCLHVSAVVVGN